MVDWLPSAVQPWILWLPMVQGSELLREGFLGLHIHAHYSLAYLVSSCALLTLLGLYFSNVVIDYMDA